MLQALVESRHEVVLVVTHPPGDDAYETIWTDSVQELAERARRSPCSSRRCPTPRPQARVRGGRRRRDGGLQLAHVDPAGDLQRAAPGDAQRPRLAAARLRRLRAAELGAHQRRAGGRHHRARHGRAARPRLDHPAAARDRRADGHDRRPLRQDARAVRPDDDRGASTTWSTAPASAAPQDLTQASFFHKRADEDNRIDWTWPAQDIANLVRAQADPYPNAYCFHGVAPPGDPRRVGLARRARAARAGGSSPARATA